MLPCYSVSLLYSLVLMQNSMSRHCSTGGGGSATEGTVSDCSSDKKFGRMKKRGAGNVFWANVFTAKVVSRNALKFESIFNIIMTPEPEYKQIYNLEK